MSFADKVFTFENFSFLGRVTNTQYNLINQMATLPRNEIPKLPTLSSQKLSTNMGN